MAEVLPWLVVFLAIALVIWGLVRENDRRRQRTVEEWERDYAAGQGKMTQFIRAGGLGLDGILISEKRGAVQYQKDEEQGMTKTGNKGDDADRTAAAKE
jgi:acyl CoA:acetate/3-ketoacid CoA transferase alpha subunit